MRRLSFLPLSSALLCVATAVSLLVGTGAASADDLTLAENGRSDYAIVLPDAPSPVQKTAANELRSYFAQATGVELPILAEKDAAGKTAAKFIVVGPGPLSQKLLGAAVDETQIAYDGIVMKRVGDSVVLTGHPQRGSLYAVYEFLETRLGVRWWTSTETTVPKSAVVKVDELDYAYAPKLEYRDSYYRGVHSDGIFAARLKCNGHGAPAPDEYGAFHRFQYFVHSAYNLIPPAKYYLDHPDWFPEIDGVRKVGWPAWAGSPEGYAELVAQLKPEQIHESGTQLCFTNDEMIAEMTKNALEALRKNPKASFLSVSQNDWHGYCQCEKCRKIDEENDSHAGSLLYGVNKVAEAVEKEFPNVYVETLAYQYTRKPPKVIRPRDNVVVRLCSIECSFSQPLASEQNKTFREDVEGWSKIADKLFVWDYVTNFALYLLPFPNYRVLDPNIDFYVDHNVVGLFEQGDYQAETGDFVQLRAWVIAKLLWNPSLDPKKLVDEFIAGYYAPELVPIYGRYFDVLSNAVEKSGVYLTIYRQTANDWLDPESLNEATRLQNEALAVATKLETENPERYAGLVKKVRRERIPLDLVWLQEYHAMKLESKLTGGEFVGPADPYKAALDFGAKLDEFGLTLYREADTPDGFQHFKQDFVDRYEGYDGSDPPTPEICADLPLGSWLDVQEFAMRKSRVGDWTFVEKDAAASNGRAVKMPGTHYEWATTWSFSTSLARLKSASGKELAPGEAPKYRVYAYVRADASVKDGSAMTLGVYDEEAKRGVAHKDLSVEEIAKAEYACVDLGLIEVRPSQYIWFAPPKRPGEVDAVFVDRVIVVRE
ncbi:MAG: DUF4838 domain-containing protein [Thermoguttaceae bacterium]|nr:DUF4838 domain-containing protein [Thermoguttaceae bacterium]